MKPIFFFFLSIVILISNNISLNEGAAVAPHTNKDNEVYIVYMGGPTPANRHSPAQTLINGLLRRNRNAVVHSYKHGFSGFAARLSEQEARQIAGQAGVVSVFKDPTLKLHTTHSWEFLQYQTSVEIQSSPRSPPSSFSSSAAASQTQGSDTIIGILDTGIWPESDSFNDKDMGPVPARWKGTCMESKDFPASKCNRKLIGARYYKDPDSSVTQTVRDSIGHGTHVSSTAAGFTVANASYYGLAAGTAKGGSPGSHIAMYRVCTDSGCRGSAILAAFDDAIADGVDILSLSLGSSSFYAPEYSTDPIAIGSFHAVQKGITVVCSAGNEGPDGATVINVAPWILTVAATTIDRSFESDAVLGNGDAVKGEGINFSNLQDKPTYTLIDSVLAKTNSSLISSARRCDPSSLDGDKIKGKIVFCSAEGGLTSTVSMVASQGAVGVILVNDVMRFLAMKSLSFPATIVSSKDADSILSYINSTGNPVATISKTTTATQFKPAPTLAYFSSRGPSYSTRNILKPDIAAPGVNILAAWLGNDTDKQTTPPGMKPPLFNLLSGTSMSCPHVSGIAATVKSRNPTWSPAAIRSAIMTTAIQTNNMKGPLTTHKGEVATPYEYGAGEVNPPAALNPGLVYDTDPADYLQFLCNYGYNSTQIKLLQPSLPDGFNCPKDSNKDMIWNLNYPSIAVSKDIVKTGPVNVTRTLTNVGAGGEYKVKVDAPSGLDVKVVPETLSFTSTSQKLSFQVVFTTSSGSSSINKEVFGTITWSNGKNDVRSPFVITSI